MTQTGEATRPSAGARSPGRRGFLLGVGGLAAAALVGAGGGWSRSEQVTSAPASSSQPSGCATPFPQPQPNGDEDRYDVVGLANFTKALPHNDLGEVDPAAYRALLRALRSGRWRRHRGSTARPWPGEMTGGPVVACCPSTKDGRWMSTGTS